MESNSTAFLIKIKLRHSLGKPSRSDFVQSEFVERFPELSLFYGLSSPLGSEMICIFPYFCPCEEIRKGNKGNFYLGIARYLIKKSCGIPLCFSC